jgi:hypothetical protein
MEAIGYALVYQPKGKVGKIITRVVEDGVEKTIYRIHPTERSLRHMGNNWGDDVKVVKVRITEYDQPEGVYYDTCSDIVGRK